MTLKSFLWMAVVAVLSTSVVSCKSHQRCAGISSAEDKPKMTSKRYRAAVAERDSLCSYAQQKNSELEALGKNYEELKSSSGSTVANLSGDLRNKEDELKKKEQVLKDKEKRLKELEEIVSRQDSVMSALTKTVKNALLGFNADELSVSLRDGKVYVSMSDKLLFKSGNADVEAKGKSAIEKLAGVLNKNSDVSIAIEGHTDNVPIRTSIYKDNWDLSAARATNVVRMLTEEFGMDPKRLTAAGKGEFSPVADNTSPEGKAKNRRTEIVLSPKLDELMKAISYN